jgi:hypothetical protein
VLYREHVDRDFEPVERRMLQILVEPTETEARSVEALIAELAAVETRRRRRMRAARRRG